MSASESIIGSPNVHTYHSVSYDAVVIGAGVAGLAFALQLPETWRVGLLTKGDLGESNTRYAQGGLSAAIGLDDSPRLHEQDTVIAGANLNQADAVATLVESAPEAVHWLLDIGTMFDRDAATGKLELGKEAAHSRHRVLHAGGDATGAEIERSLVAAVLQHPSIDVFENAFAIDLDVEDGECAGVVCHLGTHHQIVRFVSPTVVLAAGGAGQLWAVTSNPPGSTADGLAMAVRAGATIADTEFVQFHPTVLALPGEEPFLVSEAVRGEGAFLVNKDGYRFMFDIHPQAELAPRDVVARGIHNERERTGDEVYLVLDHLDPQEIYRRFPTITQELKNRGLDLARDRIPVAPAAHYFIGGIAAGANGRTSLPGLLALGEVSCTGVHGANRLASNSLLEGLVFGTDAARLVAESRPRSEHVQHNYWEPPRRAENDLWSMGDPSDSVTDLIHEIQTVMSREVGVVRDASGLEQAASSINCIITKLESLPSASQREWEARNMATAARAVISAAAHREESRGAHYRSDFPDPIPSLSGQHSILADPRSGDWTYGSIEDAIASPAEQHRVQAEESHI